jgi:hypothetical protein
MQQPRGQVREDSPHEDCMKVLLSSIGSRGDVQDLVAIAVDPEFLGHGARPGVPPDSKEWIESFGITCLPIGPGHADGRGRGGKDPLCVCGGAPALEAHDAGEVCRLTGAAAARQAGPARLSGRSRQLAGWTSLPATRWSRDFCGRHLK